MRRRFLAVAIATGAAAAIAATLRAPRRIASFAVPGHGPFAAGLVEQWVE